MSSPAAVEAYFAAIPDPAKRAALADLRALLQARLPVCSEVLSYAMPGFRLPGRKGKMVIGYAAFARHCGIYPHSGGIIGQMQRELQGWDTSKSGVLFTPDHPLPAELVERIITLRLAEIGAPEGIERLPRPEADPQP